MLIVRTGHTGNYLNRNLPEKSLIVVHIASNSKPFKLNMVPVSTYTSFRMECCSKGGKFKYNLVPFVDFWNHHVGQA